MNSAAASSIVRIVLVKDFKKAKLDPTWALLNVGVWTLIELHIAIIVASLPPSRALALRLWASARGKVFTDTSYGTSGNSSARGNGSGSRWGKKTPVVVSERGSEQEGWLRMQDLGDRGSARTDLSERPLDPMGRV